MLRIYDSPAHSSNPRTIEKTLERNQLGGLYEYSPGHLSLGIQLLL